MRTIIIAVALGASILIWVPNVVFSRLTFSTEADHGKTEGRARIYLAAVEHFPEYAMTGVGAGNFWGPWGERSAYLQHNGLVYGAHNCFIQVMINWGLLALLTYLVIVWQAYRCLPRRCGADALSRCLLGIAVSLFLLMLVSHRLAAKEFSIGLGLLVAAHCWIWPAGIVPLRSRKQRPFRPFTIPA
jgi:O-antigen ligase